jgi:NADH:ubiquinone oxidoreductase subunit B-like Fe-S oxidoreductase
MSKAPTGMELVGKLSDVPPDAFLPGRTVTPEGVADAVRRLMSAVRQAIDDRDAEVADLRKALARARGGQ